MFLELMPILKVRIEQAIFLKPGIVCEVGLPDRFLPVKPAQMVNLLLFKKF